MSPCMGTQTWMYTEIVSPKTVPSNCLRNLYKCWVCSWSVHLKSVVPRYLSHHQCSKSDIFHYSKGGTGTSLTKEIENTVDFYFQCKSPDKKLYSLPLHFSFRFNNTSCFYRSDFLSCCVSSVRVFSLVFTGKPGLQKVLSWNMKRFCFLIRPIKSPWGPRRRWVASPSISSHWQS